MLVGSLATCLVYWLVGLVFGCLVRSVGWFVLLCLLVGGCVAWLFVYLCWCFVACWVACLVAWCVGCFGVLVGWSFVCFGVWVGCCLRGVMFGRLVASGVGWLVDCLVWLLGVLGRWFVAGQGAWWVALWVGCLVCCLVG